MRARLFVWLISASLAISGAVALAQSTPTEKTTPTTFDACTLIQSKEVETIQGSPIKEAKSSERSDGDFRVSQCFYTAAEFSRSITLTMYQKHPTDPAKRNPIDFWKHTFARYEEEETEKEKDAEKKEEAGKKEHAEQKKAEPSRGREEEEGAPPRKIPGLGDEAFWLANRFGGTLYVLKGNAFISISIGGTDTEESKIDKSKKLAAKALRRL